MIIISMDGHSSSYSTPALKALGLYSENHNGILSGEAHEFNMGKVQELILKGVTPANLSAGVQHMVNEVLNYGIVGVHCLDGLEDAKKDMLVWLLSKFSKVIPLRLRLYVQYKNSKRVQPYVKHMRHPRIGGCGSWEMDGSVGPMNKIFR